MVTHQSPPAGLSAAEHARLDTHAVEIAEEALGLAKEEGEGSWRVGESRGLIIHPGALFYDFRSGSGGRGTIDLIKHLSGIDDAAAVDLARRRLAQNDGEGRLAASVPNNEKAAKSEHDAARIAQVQTMFERRGSSKGTPVELYLTSRHLQADDNVVGWLEPAWPGAYGEMITAATDEQGNVLAIQLTRLTSDGRKAPLKCPRVTYRGPHDWSSRAVLRLNCEDGPIDTFHLVEGFEDGLSLAAAGVQNIWVLWGVGRLGRVELPLGVKTVVVVRDDDRDNADAETALWRGVTRLCGQGVDEVRVTPRPRLIAPDATGPMKDVNDLQCHGGPALVQKLLDAEPVGKEDLPAAAREAILDEASLMSRDAYFLGRKLIAKQLGYTVITPLDDERKARIAKRMEARPNGDPNRDEFLLLPYEDPVTDLDAVLDDNVGILKKILAVPNSHLDTMALWALHTHLLQRKELGIRHTPRLAFQSPLEDSGKTTAMETLLYVAARAVGTSSLTGASLYRETDARHPTVLWDEADNAFHKNTAPELLGVFNAGWSKKFSLVHRQVPNADGEYETHTFNTFTGIALTAIKAFPSRAMQSRCIVLGMKRATRAEAAVLEEFDETHEEALTECGRKFVRWSIDIEALPTVDKKTTGLINRIWLNWRPLLQIAALAGGTWPARALAAAKADMARVTGEKDNSPDYALLASIWRVLAADDSDPRRMLTEDLLQKLLNEEDGRWLTANRGGKQIDKWYLRDKLKDYLPTEGKYSNLQSRRWRPVKSAKCNPQWGYYELHFADAFERYLGKGLPSAEPRTPDLTADDPDPGVAQEGHTPQEGVSPALLSDTPDTRPKKLDNAAAYSVSDNQKNPTHVSDATPLHPTHGQGVSDEAYLHPTHVSDKRGVSGTQKHEQSQHVSTVVSGVSDKSVGERGIIGTIPDASGEIIHLPQGGAGRKARREPPL